MGIIIETSLFGNLKQEENPKVLLIPVPYEYTTSYCKGTKNGPQAILNASIHIEKFDDELWADISKIGINTSGFVLNEFVSDKSKQPFVEIESAVRNAVIKGCLPVVLGGEHSISYGSMKAVYELFPNISILIFDACLNLKENHQNNKFSRLSLLRRLYELMPEVRIVLVGTRAFSEEETTWLDTNNPNIEIFLAREKDDWNISEIISNLTKSVYISFNFNVLDPGIMPSCSGPEPLGILWEKANDVLRNVCTFKEIVGMDFVEFSPINGLCAPDLLAAKLVYRTIGYIFARQLGAFEEKEEKEILEAV